MQGQRENLFLSIGSDLQGSDLDPNYPIIPRKSPVLKRKNHQTAQLSSVYNALNTEHDENISISKIQDTALDRITKSRRQGIRSIQLAADVELRQQIIINHTLEVSVDSPSSPLNGFTNRVWQHKSLNILILVLRFISHITKANFTTSFKLINRNVFNLIDDKSTDFDFYKFNHHFIYEKPSRIQIRLYQLYIRFVIPLTNTNIYKHIKERLLPHSFLLKPEQSIMVIWNIYIITVLTISMYYTTLRLAFPIDSQRHQLNQKEICYDLVPNCSFMFEIFLKFNTCYYERGHLITDRLKIARYYINTSMTLDIVVVLPFFITFIFDQSYFDLLVILKVLQVTKLADSLFSRLELTSNEIALFDLFKLIYMILLLSHFVACLWYMIGLTDTESSWIITQRIEDADWVVLYFYSIYWSIITMTTIGYGDITPINLKEKIFVTGITLLSCGMFAYSINKIGNIFGELAKKSNQFRSDMNSLKKYLRTKGIQQNLQDKVRRYFEFIWSEENENHDDEFKFEEVIPQHLRDEMIIDINSQIIKKITFLKDNFSEDFLITLCQYFKSRRLGPEEVIYQLNTPSDNFYILNHGEVQTFITIEHKITKEISLKLLELVQRDSMIFGHLDFFQDAVHQSSAKSTKVTDILVVSRADFLNVIQKYPNDFQNYCQMKDLVQFSSRLDEISVFCRACNKSNHVVQQCPMVMGTPNKSKVLYNYLKHVPSGRVEFLRTNDQRRISTLAEQANLQESVIIFLLSNDEYSHHLHEIKEQIRNENLKQDSSYDVNYNCSPLDLPTNLKIHDIKDAPHSGLPIHHQSTPKKNYWHKVNTNIVGSPATKLPIQKSKTSTYVNVAQNNYRTIKSIQALLPKINEEQNLSQNPIEGEMFLKESQEASPLELQQQQKETFFLDPENVDTDQDHTPENSPVLINGIRIHSKRKISATPQLTELKSIESRSYQLNPGKLKPEIIVPHHQKPSISVAYSEDYVDEKFLMVRTHYKDIFEDFDCIRSYPKYFFDGNIEEILSKNQFVITQEFNNRNKKKRQVTIMNMLSQKRSRINKGITSRF